MKLRKTTKCLLVLNLLFFFSTPILAEPHYGTSDLEVSIEVDPEHLPIEPTPEIENNQPHIDGNKPVIKDKPQLENASNINDESSESSKLPATGMASYGFQFGITLIVIGLVFIAERREYND